MSRIPLTDDRVADSDDGMKPIRWPSGSTTTKYCSPELFFSNVTFLALRYFLIAFTSAVTNTTSESRLEDGDFGVFSSLKCCPEQKLLKLKWPITCDILPHEQVSEGAPSEPKIAVKKLPAASTFVEYSSTCVIPRIRGRVG